MIAVIDVGVAVLRSGLADTVVQPWSGDLATWLWILALPALLSWLAFLSRGWTAAAAVLLVLGSPLVAAFTYAIGSFDANPWYEAMSGVLGASAGVCLLMEAARRSARQRGVPAESAVM